MGCTEHVDKLKGDPLPVSNQFAELKHHQNDAIMLAKGVRIVVLDVLQLSLSTLPPTSMRS